MNRADAVKTIADASKMRAKAKLRKQAIKEAKYEDSIMMIDTLIRDCSPNLYYCKNSWVVKK